MTSRFAVSGIAAALCAIGPRVAIAGSGDIAWTPYPVSWPRGRGEDALAWDTARGRLVMVGCDSAVWEWNPVTRKWSHSTPSTAPPPRCRFSLTHDVARGVTVLFGGTGRDDTWEWNGAAWTDVTPGGAKPAPRAGHGAAYTTAGRIAMFGGLAAAGADCPGQDDADPAIGRFCRDLWMWNGATGTWTDRTAAPLPRAWPPPTAPGALAFDPIRSRVLLFGGHGPRDSASMTPSPSTATWEWDPASGAWTDRTSSPVPQQVGDWPFSGPLLVYDAARATVTALGSDSRWWNDATGRWSSTGFEKHEPTRQAVAYTGFGQSMTFDCAGPRVPCETTILTWGGFPPLSRRPAPGSRTGARLAYDPGKKGVYLFGGATSATGGSAVAQNDLWSWNGSAAIWTTWPDTVISRSDALVYDPVRKRVVLFGAGPPAAGYPPPLEWAGSAWSARTPGSPSPPFRTNGAFAYDEGRSRIVMFGGAGGEAPRCDPTGERPCSDLWEWDGGSALWTERTPVGGPSPAPRGGASLIGLPGTSRLFLLGGTGSRCGSGACNDLWEWDGAAGAWTDRTPVPRPAETGPLVYERALGRVILVGSKLWSLDPVSLSWAELAPAAPPAPYPLPAAGVGAAYDDDRKAIVLFGGAGPAGESDILWEGFAAVAPDGEACAGGRAGICASGHCVDEICCATACDETCRSCAQSGQAGRCALAPAGKADPDAKTPCTGICDASGTCRKTLGEACESPAECGSGFCASGRCCNQACTDVCRACDLPGRGGQCGWWPPGSNAQGRCGSASEPCGLSCNAAGQCVPAIEGAFCAQNALCKKGRCVRSAKAGAAGCGCRAGSPPGPGDLALALLAALALVAARRGG